MLLVEARSPGTIASNVGRGLREGETQDERRIEEKLGAGRLLSARFAILMSTLRATIFCSPSVPDVFESSSNTGFTCPAIMEIRECRYRLLKILRGAARSVSLILVFPKDAVNTSLFHPQSKLRSAKRF